MNVIVNDEFNGKSSVIEIISGQIYVDEEPIFLPSNITFMDLALRFAEVVDKVRRGEEIESFSIKR